MNKIIASVGLVALGAANVQAQNAMTGPAAKWWNVSATVRGFYDDNINTVQDPGPHDHVFGFEVKPKIGVTWSDDQTIVTADYAYSFLQYDKRPAGNTHKYDQDHTFNAAITHAFSERYSIQAHDSFVIGQEPDALRHDAAFHTPFRVAGDNIVNNGGFLFTAEMTRLLGLEIGYDNAFYDYHDAFAVNKNTFTVFDPVLDENVTMVGPASLSGMLDRDESTPRIALTWQALPDTTVRAGYRYSMIKYTGYEVIGGPKAEAPRAPGTVISSDRNVNSHTIFLGLDHKFNPNFYGSVEAGGSYYDYYRINETSWGPYARLSLTDMYMPESSVTVGFQESRSPSDQLGLPTSKTDIVRDQETSTLFANVRQRIMPKFFANLNGSFQNGTFKGGTLNDVSERFYEFGANLEYVFNPHISAMVGYDFDRLDSEIPHRSYTRNKFYIGATASY
jgi:hypothetical protein